MGMEPLAVGVITASAKQLGELSRLVRGAGCRLSTAFAFNEACPPNLASVDAWLVSLDLQHEPARQLQDKLEASGVPVIYADDLEPPPASPSEPAALPAEIRQQKERRFAAKLRQLVREANVASMPPRAQKVWVIAASTGGPDAVVEFLRGLPETLTGVALLYVQHIDTAGHNNLCSVIAKQCRWSVATIDAATVIREKTIYMVSPAQQIEISDGGVVSPSAEPWAGRYRPSIDQVIAKVARAYRNRAGAIVFTGMGDDGAGSCTLMHHRGGQVWVQQAAHCTIDSMPVSVAEKGCVSFSGKPSALAEQFVYFQRHGRLCADVNARHDNE